MNTKLVVLKHFTKFVPLKNINVKQSLLNSVNFMIADIILNTKHSVFMVALYISHSGHF